MRNLLIYIIFTSISYASSGSVVGTVIDANTHQPLIGANVMIENTIYGTACDMEGEFSISNIAVGSYTVTISMIGYSSISRANVNIYSNRQTPLTFYLTPESLKGDIVTVQAGFFERAKDGIVSTQTIGFEEIRSDPSGSWDIQRMIQSLPSVMIDNDQHNEIIVRGGGPGENLFVMDHLEIPNPNHFGEVGSGGGPVNMLNTEFVERIDFFAGGFPSRYGDKQSSVMDVSLREGNYDNIDIDLEMTMAGVGVVVEGPFPQGKGSYISSYRKAFLKDIVKSAGMTAIPEYWNSQTKIVYNFDNRNKLMFNLLGGWDYIKIEDENRPDLRGAENVEHTGYQYTVGLTYKSLFSKFGYSLLSVGKNTTDWITDVYKNKEDTQHTYFSRNNRESDNFIKGDIVYKISSDIEISAGFNGKYGEYSLHDVANPDTIFTYSYSGLSVGSTLQDYYALIISNPDYAYDSTFHVDESVINDSIHYKTKGGLWKIGIYSQIKYQWNKVLLTAGIRYNGVQYNNTSLIAPRLALSYGLSPITKLNMAYGYFYQTPNYWMLMHPKNTSPLKHAYTKQQVIGIEHYFQDDMKGSIEFYNKTYHNKPIDISDTTSAPYDERLGFIDIGKGRSYGVELFLQKKFAHKWYGTFSYSYSKSEGVDFRGGKEEYYPWDFDYGNVMTIIGGYKFNFRESKWYQRLRESVVFPYISWIPFMVSDQLEVSFRYRYSGGRPYTPKVYNFHYRRWYVDTESGFNAKRSNYYSRFDLMILRRFNFKKINVTTFIDIQNIFDRSNEWEIMYLDDGTTDMSYQYKQMPIGGIIIEF